MNRVKNDLMYYVIALVLGGVFSPIIFYFGLIIEYVINIIGFLFGVTTDPWKYHLTPLTAWIVYSAIITVIMIGSWIHGGTEMEDQKQTDIIARAERSYDFHKKRLEHEKQVAHDTAVSETFAIANQSSIPHLSETDKNLLLNDLAIEVKKWLDNNNYIQVGRSKAVWCLKHGYSLEVALDVANHYTYKGEENRKSLVELSGAVVRKYLKS